MQAVVNVQALYLFSLHKLVRAERISSGILCDINISFVDVIRNSVKTESSQYPKLESENVSSFTNVMVGVQNHLHSCVFEYLSAGIGACGLQIM